MKERKINVSFLLCEIVIFMQLLWMQKKVFFPNIGNFFYNTIYYMKYIGAFVLFLYTFLIKRDETLKEIRRKYSYIFIPLFILIIVVEIIAFMQSPTVESYGLSYWTRFSSYFLDKLFVVLSVGSIWIICQKNTIRCISNVLIFNGLLIAMNVIINYGVSETLSALLAIFGLASENVAMKTLEVHELTYCVGLCLLYYLFFRKKEEKPEKFRIILLSIIFILGGKRIGFAGLAVGGLISALIHKKGLTKKIIITIGIIGVIISFSYVAILYNGKFLTFMSEHNINVMGRDVIYQYFIKKTDFSINFNGWGFASISKNIESMTRADVGNMVNVRGLHNDILKIYIECGFIFSLIWFYMNLIHFPIQIFNKLGKREATLYISLIIFAFITYLTDNTENYFVFQTILFLLPLAVKSEELELNNKLSKEDFNEH